jgi:hypothetical protein
MVFILFIVNVYSNKIFPTCFTHYAYYTDRNTSFENVGVVF